MKKLLLHLAALLYRYYSKGRDKEIRYFTTLCMMLISFFGNILTLISIIGIPTPDVGRDFAYLSFLPIGVPSYFLLRHYIPEKEVAAFPLVESRIKKEFFWMFSYLFGTVALAMIFIKLEAEGYSLLHWWGATV